MYCVKCGVELADSERRCPLCGTAVFHPEISRPDGQPPFPRDVPVPAETVNRSGLLFVISMLFALPIVISLLCDWQINGRVVWSGYVSGAIVLFYIVSVLPLWFKRPNPVVFIPVDFAAAALYLLYIDLAADGGWYLSFALPVCCAAGLIITAAAALFRYLRRGQLFIFGGAFILSGGFMVLVEFLLNLTFGLHEGFIWSFYPLAACFILGVTLIVIGICRPIRESLHKKFFI